MGSCHGSIAPSTPLTPTESLEFLVQLQGGAGVPKGFDSTVSESSKGSLTEALGKLFADVH